MKTRIILITHPHTDWTMRGQYQGHIDVPLNDTGYVMIDKLVKRLSDEIIDCVYSCDLQRTFQTAAVVAASKDIKHITDIRLREGRWEIQEDVHDYPLMPFYKELESKEEILERAIDVMTEIAEAHIDETVFVVSHWGLINLFISYILNHDYKFNDIYLGIFQALNFLEYESGVWRCVQINDDQFLYKKNSQSNTN